jgi:hypothetical protein
MSQVTNIEETRLRKERQSNQFIAAWTLKDLAPKKASDWLSEALRKTTKASLAASIWAHYPNLKLATEKLSLHITPFWPSDSNESAFHCAVQQAIDNVNFAVDQGDQFSGRIIALYLHGLASCVTDISNIHIVGKDNKGEQHAWSYFSEPLQTWAKKHKMKEIEAHLATERVSDEEILGLRQHLVASICNPRETGFFAAYAPAYAPVRRKTS